MNIPSMLKEQEIIPRAATAIALVLAFVWFHWVQKNPVGYVSETKDDVTRVLASSSPVLVVISILGISLFIFLMSREIHVEIFQPSSLRRRAAAFCFDLWFLLLTVVGVSSLLHLLLEAQRSGTFRWRYEQEFVGPPGAADFVIILVNLTVMFMYFVIPLTRRGQTVGQWLFRLVTVSAGGNFLRLPFSMALWRTFMAFRGFISPWKFWKETDARRRTWYDRETGFVVVRF